MRPTRLPLLLILLLASPVMAAEMSLEECLRMGGEQNPALKAAGAAVEMAEQDVNIANAGFFPTVHLEGAYTRWDQPPHFTLKSGLFGPGFPPEDTRVEGESSHYSAGVRLRQKLFTGGFLTGTHSGRVHLAEAERHGRDDQQRRLILQIKQSYYNALAERHQLATAKAALSAKDEEVRIKRELLASGRTTSEEVLSAEGGRLAAATGRLQAEQAYLRAADNLSVLVGAEETVDVVEPDVYETLAPDFDLQQTGQDQARDDIRRLDARVSAADMDVKAAQSGYYPQLELAASYLTQRETDITDKDIWEAGLTLDWVIFDAGQTRAEVARAHAEAMRLRHLRRDLTRRAEQEERSALRSVRELEALVEAHRQQLLASEQAHRYRLERYREGKQTGLDILNGRAELARAEGQYRISINRLQAALAELEASTGQPLAGWLSAQRPYRPAVDSLKLELPAKENSADTQPRQALGVAEPRFSVQLGAFRSEQGASKFLAELRAAHPAREFAVVKSSGMQKVRAINFATLKSAQAALIEFGGGGFVVHGNSDD